MLILISNINTNMKSFIVIHYNNFNNLYYSIYIIHILNNFQNKSVALLETF